jgi:CubicO group peptidase (beta-lactamase class C family)
MSTRMSTELTERRTSSVRAITLKPHKRLLMLGMVVLALCLIAPASAFAEGEASRAADPDFAAIDAYIQKEMRELHIPGLTYGIVHDDQVVHLESFGEADPSGRAVTPQTPFILASVSKPFTALAIMQLSEAGKVDLDAPVQRYVPWFHVADKAASGRITVRNLLNHTSGLPEDTSFEPMRSNDMSDEALEERVRALSDVRLNHRVGAAFEYTDANYDVLGLIVQRVAGQSYESYVQEHIFAPLNMGHSFINQTAAQRHGLATGHRSWFSFPMRFEAPYSRAAMPSSYFISSTQDMTHYLIAQLNAGRYADTSVLSPEGVAAMHRPAVREGDKDVFYGMGWERRSTTSGVPGIQHGGTNSNFYADMVLEPEGRWGVVILANFNSFNLNGGRVQGLSSGVISLLHGQAPPDVPMPHHPILASAVLLVAVVSVLQVLGIVRSVVILRRWRTQPHRRPRGRWGVALRVGVPLVLNVGWVLFMLIGFPKLLYPLSLTLLLVPDLGYLVVVSGAVALSWGILRTVLANIAMRKRGTPNVTEASVPKATKVPVDA